MKRKNLTRNALFTSVLSLLLCVSMLVGTTFAWFTDSVESGMNTIAAGNLDVELYYQVEGQSDWTKVDASTNVFMKDALWEPGHTEVVKLKVVNEGSLALNYQLGVNVASETEGTRYNKEIGKDETFKLSDYIKFGIVEDAQTYTREQAVAAVDATANVLKTAYNSKAIALLPKTATNADNEDIVTMVVYMPTTVGNEANHKTGTTPPVINLGINLFATQQMSESDSFGSDYDALAQGAYASDEAPEDGKTKEYTLFAKDASGVVTSNKVGTMRINSKSVEDSNKPIEISIIPTDQDKNVTVTADQKAQSYDITVSNLKEGNTTPIEVELNIGTGKSGVQLYHKGVKIDDAVYKPNTGYVVFKTLSFSPYTVVFDAEPAANASSWNGTADTTWYDPDVSEYAITTAEELAGLAELVNGGNTFKDKTIKLGKNIDLYCEDTTPAADGDPLTFRPIGDHSKNGTFEGTFDGNGHTIYNLYQNGWDLGYEWGKYGSYGLFGNINDATIKNLTISGAESYIEGGDVGGITGSATGTCVFENITIKDSNFATYNNGCGGIIAWSGAGNYTFKNITIEEDVTLAGLWGSFDSSIGGIVGQAEPGATYNFENVNVKCRIDAYNDCTASYDYYNYRMCGMIMGRLEETTTIDGANYPDTSKYNITCNNVTVTYGDWANYHYCRATGARAQRVEAGYSYGGVAADHDHSKCTAHCKELIAFDQIFGGDQYAVKGLKTYTGVDVIYNNK